jgi:cytochrome P450/deferrochelatase/peroxidase EfeB
MMFEPKYYDGIRKAQAETNAQPKDALPPFNLEELGADSLKRRITHWLFDVLMPPALFLFRELCPVFKFGRFVLVTRERDVRDVLARTDEFETPFGLEMTELSGGGANFVLGMEGEAHDQELNQIREVIGDQRSRLTGTNQPIEGGLSQDEIAKIVFARKDVELVTQLSNRFAKALIRNSGGRIDVMKDFITRVATETCIRYFGLTVDDPDAFADWSMSISAVLFADPTGDPTTRKVALNGAARIRNVISVSMIQQRPNPTDTVLGRMIKLQQRDPRLTNDVICSILVGMIAGFVPTNTLAAGRIFQALQRHPKAMGLAMEYARGAARADAGGQAGVPNPDKDALHRLLFEAVRLSPPLTPGQWRYAKQEATIGTYVGRRKTVPAGTVLMVATMSALRDHRAIDAPGTFIPDREPANADLAFGTGEHQCLGKYLAMAQFTELFMVLLSQANLRYATDTYGSRIRWVGPFPNRLDMEFDPPTAPGQQSMITICAPLLDPDRADAVRAEIAALGNPATQGLCAMLDATSIVHFASLAVIEAGDDKEPTPYLLLELNCDGPQDTAIETIVAADTAAGGKLLSVFQNTLMAKDEPLVDVLKAYALNLQTRPWGAIGLNFNGTPEFPVVNIEAHQKLSEFARDALDYFLTFHSGIGNRAMQVLTFVRSFIVHPQVWANVNASSPQKLQDLVRRGKEFDASDTLIIPNRRRLGISDWKDRTKWEATQVFLKSRDFWSLALWPIGVGVLFAIFILFATKGPALSLGLPGRLLLASTGAIAATLILLGIIVAAFLWWLRRKEDQDVSDDQNPSLKDIKAIAQVENPPGFAHNHFMAVTPLKSGWFRKLTLAMSLWGIKQMVKTYFRPGFVLNMGTIHYAKWFRLPGYDKLIFLSNFDGSWESYLEDFIMRAHAGQTAAWSNGVGFPKTRFLILDGAQDGDKFKRWVRRQQRPSQFWYSRFHGFTTDQIHANALIHDGLARASNDLAARDWLDCFGSIPRPDYAIETDEVQSLVFRGQADFSHAVYALLRLPETPKAAAPWLRALVHGARPDGTAREVNHCEVTFGDNPFASEPSLRTRSVFVAFSSTGLAKLGLSDPSRHDGLGTFPSPFNIGMSNRARQLGDWGNAAPEAWRWGDSAIEGAAQCPPGADAILIICAKEAATCDAVLQRHLALLGEGALLHVIPTAPLTGGLPFGADEDAATRAYGRATDRRAEYEHFGFRDGISQPIIRGTQRFLKRVHDRDVVEPGEFILGYRNNQGYYGPAATVAAESDHRNHLPTVLADVPSRFPTFEDANKAVRDFGRNGSFLVVRQLAQDVDGFKSFVGQKAKDLKHDYPNLADVAGAPIDAKWLAAKIVGRWPDGTPLVERPGADTGEGERKHSTTENDFTFGVDDPQGLRCPFGAHIRRTNPRDSLEPGDAFEVAITNRHRLLRRGRSYEYAPAEGAPTEKGLVFACLCADLDRQFEFVQQTWLQSPNFHGLREEPDPLLGQAGSGRPAVFTIPTPSGPVCVRGMQSFVTVRAGGYFFLPSHSAIQYLIDINQPGYEPQK